MTNKMMKSVETGMVYPIPLEEIENAKPKRKYGLLEVQDEEHRKELSKMFCWMINYPCHRRGICLDSNIPKQAQDFRYEEVYSLARKLLGEDWSCEEFC